MTITEITVHASAGFNHPFEQYANFKPGVTLTAELDKRDDVAEQSKKLQRLADSLVEGEKGRILASLEKANSEREAISVAKWHESQCQAIADRFNGGFRTPYMEENKEKLGEEWRAEWLNHRNEWVREHDKHPEVVKAPPLVDECPNWPKTAPEIRETTIFPQGNVVIMGENYDPTKFDSVPRAESVPTADALAREVSQATPEELTLATAILQDKAALLSTDTKPETTATGDGEGVPA